MRKQRIFVRKYIHTLQRSSTIFFVFLISKCFMIDASRFTRYDRRIMKLDRWKTAILAVIALSLLIYVFSPNFLRLTRVYRQLQILEDEIEKLQVQNQEFQDEIYSLKNDPIYIEKVAREELGMSKPKEIIYKFDREKEEKE